MTVDDDLDRVVAALAAETAATPAPALRDVDVTPPAYVLVVCIDDEHAARVAADLTADGYEVQR